MLACDRAWAEYVGARTPDSGLSAEHRSAQLAGGERLMSKAGETFERAIKDAECLLESRGLTWKEADPTLAIRAMAQRLWIPNHTPLGTSSGRFAARQAMTSPINRFASAMQFSAVESSTSSPV